jgi:hypothetical protein
VVGRAGVRGRARERGWRGVAAGGDVVGRGEEDGRAAGRQHRRSRREGGRAATSGRGGQTVRKKIEAEAEAEEPVPVGGGRDAEDAGADARWACERKANGGRTRGGVGKKVDHVFVSTSFFLGVEIILKANVFEITIFQCVFLCLLIVADLLH